MTTKQKKECLEYMKSFLTESRKKKIDSVIGLRTRYVTLVLEDICHSHNASAAIRSCEAFGIQDIHIIENNYKFKLSPTVASGSAKWVDMIRYNRKDFDNTTECMLGLKEEGYRLYAAVPDPSAISISDIPLDSKVGILIGTEDTGLSQTAIDLADAKVTLPMYGYTESFNLSVASALCLREVTDSLRNSDISYNLSAEEKHNLLYKWVKLSVRGSEMLEKRFMENC